MKIMCNFSFAINHTAHLLRCVAILKHLQSLNKRQATIIDVYLMFESQ